MRLANGAANPADIFIPTVIGTFISFMSGVIAVALYQRINLFNLPSLVFFGGFGLVMFGLFSWLHNMPPAEVATYTGLLGGLVIFSVIVSFLVLGFIKRINVYETFIEGAKDGFQTIVMIIPYLVAILVAISAFRSTGCMDYVIQGIGGFFAMLGLNTDFVPALPVGLMKTLSGGAARGLMVEAMQHYGADSFVGRLACIMQGSTETTFYILAVYFGSVNIKNTRYALTCGLIADLIGVVAAIILGYVFFH